MTSRHDRGMKTRRRVLGDAHVDRAEAAKTDSTEISTSPILMRSPCATARC